MTSLGIDHPLVCVRNLAEARETYLSLGFLMKPPGMHPWGTGQDDFTEELQKGSIYRKCPENKLQHTNVI